MLVLLDTSESLDTAAEELGCEVEQLLTPLTRFTPQRPESRFAIDNGAFAGLDIKKWQSLLDREHPRKSLCIFVTAPDVVGSARRTLELFDYWQPQLTASGWRIALVAQDGQENLPMPWDRMQAVFIGGSTEFKLSHHAAHIIKAAKAMDKWVHVGRVNTPGRFEYFEQLGADSIDGTGLSRFSHMREKIEMNRRQPRLLA